MFVTIYKKPRVMLVLWIAAIILLVLTAVNVAVSYRNTMKSVHISLASKSMQEAAYIAGKLDVSAYRTLLRAPASNQAAFARIQEQLQAAREMAGALYVYTMQIDDRQKIAKTVVTAHPPDSPLSFPPGQICNVTEQQIGQVKQGYSYYSDVIKDPIYGEYVSAGAPIYDEAGHVIGILGVDVSADNMYSIGREVLRSSTYTFVFHALFVALLAAIFLLLQKWYRRELKAAVGDTERTYQDEIRSVIASMRSIRHDFVNHMQVLYGLIECRYYDKAHEYIRTLIREAKVLDLSVRIQNPALMVLLHTKWEKARTRQILMQLEVSQHPFDQIPSVDLIKILSNLLDNAIEAAEEAEGEKRIRLCCQEDDSAYRFTVENTGPEIPPRQLTAIFQEGVSTKRRDGETPRGIGLSIVREVIRKYAGEIDVESANGVTRFQVRLPVKKR